MATYDELLQASNDDGLRRKVRVAVVIAAETIRTELPSVPNNANRLLWAKATFENPEQAAQKIIWPVLAQNKASSLAAIVGASDATVQTAVDAAVNVFATG
jgi:hypothetical protein